MLWAHEIFLRLKPNDQAAQATKKYLRYSDTKANA